MSIRFRSLNSFDDLVEHTFRDIIEKENKDLIPKCKHCGKVFISQKWLDHHLVWSHKADGY